MKLKILLAAGVFAMLSHTAYAQQAGGTEQERVACTLDAKRFCAAVIEQGDLVILSCLQQNRARLSKACGQVLASRGQ